MGGATSKMNAQVDCSNSPNCTMLYRSECSKTENTCGECISGYIGVDDDSNTACKSQTSTINTSATTDDGTTTSCTVNSDCTSLSTWHTFNTMNSVCILANQECPNSCSGHGYCVYTDKRNGISLL